MQHAINHLQDKIEVLRNNYPIVRRRDPDQARHQLQQIADNLRAIEILKNSSEAGMVQPFTGL